MATTTSGIYVQKFLMVCSTPIPEQVKTLFTMVFVNLSALIEYVWKNINNTDTFHLIIPLDCLEHLLKDPIYRFPQVLNIDVIYDGNNELKEIRRRFKSKCEKVEFCTIYDLLRRCEKAELNKALVSSSPIDRSTIDAIISIITDRLRIKELTMFNHFSPFSKQCTLPSLYGLPAKNIIDFAPCFFCPSCKLIHQQLYRLECGHQQCKVCVNIQKNCATCCKAVSRDEVIITIDIYRFSELLCSFFKISLVQDLPMKIQHIPIYCSSCKWIGSLKDYQIHFKHLHDKFITCFVRNREIDENIFYQQDSSRTNQELLLGNESDTSLNGTCIWEVSNISNLKNNVAFDEQKSIYSSSFYSFPNGYKISLRLFLNGDTKARGTYMSLYFALMRGNYDNVLRWPFQFKVTFTLLSHLLPSNNQTKCFWPNTESIAFQRPRNDMNIAYGISKFVPLKLFEQNEDHYVNNDSMFIKVEVDFLAERPSIVPFISDAGELVNEEELVDTNYDDLPRLLCYSDA
ncbi:unnamed protein product [Rotaria sp. Silwood1]|nr:unnamed protein product [Rotaria sp. Silwood1]CAF4646247.1 unnamed protein product [Rotaria sp. Silwood1]